MTNLRIYALQKINNSEKYLSKKLNRITNIVNPYLYAYMVMLSFIITWIILGEHSTNAEKFNNLYYISDISFAVIHIFTVMYLLSFLQCKNNQEVCTRALMGFIIMALIPAVIGCFSDDIIQIFNNLNKEYYGLDKGEITNLLFFIKLFTIYSTLYYTINYLIYIFFIIGMSIPLLLNWMGAISGLLS